jgi:hypothetical protein
MECRKAGRQSGECLNNVGRQSGDSMRAGYGMSEGRVETV